MSKVKPLHACDVSREETQEVDVEESMKQQYEQGSCVVDNDGNEVVFLMLTTVLDAPIPLDVVT